MGYTNTTPQFGLPQYAPADMPQREDFNKAFKTISENMGKGGDVQSVNGKTGVVNLNANDVGAADATLSNVTDKAAALANLGAVNKAGDTMTGLLSISTNVTPSVGLISSGDNKGCRIGYETNNLQLNVFGEYGDFANVRNLILYNTAGQADDKNALRWSSVVDGSAKIYDIFGAHNKPSGSYTGNGSATQRTIDVGGLEYGGNMMSISTNGCTTLVYYWGGVAFNTGQKTVVYFTSAELNYHYGVLTMATTDASVNGNSKTYYYNVF